MTFQQKVLDQPDVQRQGQGSPTLKPYRKVKSKGITDLSTKAKTMELSDKFKSAPLGFRAR